GLRASLRVRAGVAAILLLGAGDLVRWHLAAHVEATPALARTSAELASRLAPVVAELRNAPPSPPVSLFTLKTATCEEPPDPQRATMIVTYAAGLQALRHDAAG